MAGSDLGRPAIGAPWYTQFWPWFLIALPAASVAGGIATLVIAARNADSLVRADYYEAGLAINGEIARERAAAERQITATLAVDEGEGAVTVEVAGAGVDASADLVLDLSHPTRAGEDLSLRLVPMSSGRYRAPLARRLSGPWYAVLAPAGGDWRLASRVDLSGRGPVGLGGGPVGVGASR